AGSRKGLQRGISRLPGPSWRSWRARWPSPEGGGHVDDRNAQVGWTDEQWSRVRQVVSEEAHRARTAAAFLPTYGPLPPSTEVMPSELVDPKTGRVDDTKTTLIREVSRPVDLSEQQVRDEELSSALLSFRRAANAVARAEDAIIFNSQHGYRLESGRPVRTLEKISGRNEYRLRQGQSNPILESVFRQVQVKGGEEV